jgi:hypothetical protein
VGVWVCVGVGGWVGGCVFVACVSARPIGVHGLAIQVIVVAILAGVAMWYVSQKVDTSKMVNIAKVMISYLQVPCLAVFCFFFSRSTKRPAGLVRVCWSNCDHCVHALSVS